MKVTKIKKIFKDTAYVRMGGSPEELQAAQYIQGLCAELGLNAGLEAFEVDMATMHQAVLTVDGQNIPLQGLPVCRQR